MPSTGMALTYITLRPHSSFLKNCMELIGKKNCLAGQTFQKPKMVFLENFVDN